MRALTDLSLMLGAAVLGVAALWHFYWVLGGRAGLSCAVPSRESGEPTFTPSKFATCGAATLIALIAAFYAYEGVANLTHGAGGPAVATWEIAALGFAGVGFLLRAIGDFNYVGFFKRKTGTAFARADDRYFSPLCLFLAASGLLAASTRTL